MQAYLPNCDYTVVVIQEAFLCFFPLRWIKVFPRWIKSPCVGLITPSYHYLLTFVPSFFAKNQRKIKQQ